jgi:hypothetical protein
MSIASISVKKWHARRRYGVTSGVGVANCKAAEGYLPGLAVKHRADVARLRDSTFSSMFISSTPKYCPILILILVLFTDFAVCTRPGRGKSAEILLRRRSRIILPRPGESFYRLRPYLSEGMVSAPNSAL